jgi:hypothetical protein
MEMKRWLHGQSRRRRFFVLWALYATLFAGVQIAVSLGVAGYTGHVFHGPPTWVFGQDVLGAAILAAFLSRATRTK